MDHNSCSRCQELSEMVNELVQVQAARDAAWEQSCSRLAAQVLRLQRHATGILTDCEGVATVLTGLEPNGRQAA